MARIGIVATAGAGGDLQPLIASALALRDRGHDVRFIGDRSVGSVVSDLRIEVSALPPDLDLGPRLISAVSSAMERTGGDVRRAGPLVRDAMSMWAREMARPVSQWLASQRPAAAVTSLFGVEVLNEVGAALPWVVINSTFYVGPNPPRPIELDFSPRAIPLIERFSALLDAASLVLHATDQLFDLAFDGLPRHHRYVGPLGLWEPPGDRPTYLDEPGDPWVLVSISSQLEDDVPLADAAVSALADRPVRVVVTLGPDHDTGEMSVSAPNVRVEGVIPHSEVLRRATLFVSHAGHGSVMKALRYGRPMVLVPWGRDQPGVAARAEALGVAIVVPRDRASPDALGEAVARGLTDQAMRETATEHAARLERTDPPSVVSAAIETIL